MSRAYGGMASQLLLHDLFSAQCSIIGLHGLQLGMTLKKSLTLGQCHWMRVYFMQVGPIFIGQATNTMGNTQFLLSYNHHATIAQQFVVVKQATRNGILDSH